MVAAQMERRLDGLSCLVLGGGGFIGTHLCRALQRCGAAVRGFGRRRANPEALTSIPWTTGDFMDCVALARAVEGHEIVFHLLGGSTPESSNRDPVGDLLEGAAATLRLLEICRAASVRQVIFVSSGGTVYGVPAQVPIPECAATDPISAYGVNKLTIEKYLHAYHHLHGINYAVLRVANPFGAYQSPERRQGLVPTLMHRIMAGRAVEIWGDGSIVRDYIYIDDVVQALIASIGHAGPHRVFNVGSGQGRSVAEVMFDIATVLDRPNFERIHKPARATDVPLNVLDISLIRRELGWSPIAEWMDALSATATWLQQSLAGAMPATIR